MELRWVFLPALIALAASHYVLAAIALRAAAGRRLPMRDTVMTQFTAAAANRVTPGGLGGSAVNVRFLTCQGIPLRTAVAAVAAMHVLGGLADVPMIAATSPWAGGELLARLYGAATDPKVLGVAAIALIVALGWLYRRRSRRRDGGDRWADARTGVAQLVRRPRDLLVMMVASAATTLSMGVAFALSVLAVPGAADPDQAAALIVAYLIGGSVSALVPIPAGVGSTETVLIAALAALDVATGPAVQAVLLFRIVTHWAPAPIGVLTARRALLRRHRPDSSPRVESAFTAP